MNKHKNNPTFACFDLETTGFNPDDDAIIEVGIVKFTFDHNAELVLLDKYSQLVDPEKDLPHEVTAITGIKPEDLQNQPTIDQIKNDVANKFSDVDYILGHNVSFDISFLSKHIQLSAPALDSQHWTETYFPGLPSYSLDVLPFELNLERGEAHRAYDDALVSAKLFMLCLQQHRALGTIGNKILAAYKKAATAEADVLKHADSISPSELVLTKTFYETSKAQYPELINAVTKSLQENGRKIITHTAAHGIGASFVEAIISKNKINDALISISDASGILTKTNFPFLHHLDNTICEYKLNDLSEKEKLSAPEGSLIAKLFVAQALSPDFRYWPRFTFEERMYLPQVLTYKESCAEHSCSYANINQELEKKIVVLNHRDLWHEQVLAKLSSKKLLLADFDDAVDALSNKLEIKIYQDNLPNLLNAISASLNGGVIEKSKDDDLDSLPLFSFQKNRTAEKPKLADFIREVINKNDLFWGLTAITFKPEEQKFGIFFIDNNVKSSIEYRKIKEPAEKLIDSLQNLISFLKQMENQFALSYACHLSEIHQVWLDFISDDSYRTYIEKYNEQLILKLSPSPTYVSNLFNRMMPEHTVLTSATGALQITDHYINLLKIDNWERQHIKLEKEAGPILKIANSSAKSMQTCMKIFATSNFNRAVVIAKNLRETKLIAEHLTNGLEKKYKVIALDSTGSGAYKALYKFAKEESSILVTPPRGKLFFGPWPEIDLAIIATIPFPLPDPAASFMDGSLPSAMLAYKNLFAKIIKSGQPVREIYLLDERLTAQGYGKNFINLAEEFCVCPAEYIKI